MMFLQVRAAVGVFALLTVVTGLAYPLAVTGVAQAAFNDKADGSMVKKDDKVIGSELIGQSFADSKYFHSRPSAAGDGYDPASSAASNLGPTNEDLLTTITERTETYRSENGLATDAEVPSDAVTASASGLDPEISVANARLQAQRVATARSLSVAVVNKLIDDNTRGRTIGFLGDAGVNVLALNQALDATK
jgi:potassium-transporting ATPase KdpC subunit